MFSNHSCNMKRGDSYIRFILATLLLLLAIKFSSILLGILSLVFYYTAIKKFCFIYYLFKINEKYSVENYYLSFLPKHNPSAVFIFNISGKILFKNSAARQEFSHINSVSDFTIMDFQNFIYENREDVVFYQYEKRHYQMDVVGVKKEGFLLVYVTNVTELVELNHEIEETQREVIYAMGEIGETRSKETGNHVKRVALYSEQLALLYGLSREKSALLKMASPMHDIGKVGIADAILNAPRKLTTEEFEVMKTHALLGYEMLKNSNKPILKAASIVAHEHHEKFDGSGYPSGLKGDNIHIYGRITAVADVFDALGSERVYKKAWPLEKILKLFEKESGAHFDPTLIKLFQDNLDTFLSIRDSYKD